MWLKPALMLDFSISVEARTRSLAVGQTTIAGLQENLGGAFAAAAESTALHGTASMTGGIAAVISSVVISMLIVAGVTAGAL